MTTMTLQEHAGRFFPAATERLRGVLFDSRQRWREMAHLSADIAFETDHLGRLTRLHPDPVLGWTTGLLLGSDGVALLADPAGFNPFQATAPARHRRTWLRRRDGGDVCFAISIEPIRDPLGHVVGVRGAGVDMTTLDVPPARSDGSRSLGDALDYILSCMGREILAPKMLQAALEALATTMAAEGTAVVGLHETSAFAHHAGSGMEVIRPDILALLDGRDDAPAVGTAADGRQILADICHTRFGDQTGLAAWRAFGERPWDTDDIRLIAVAGKMVRMVLEHDTIQREMWRQARTDSLTGLLNRRAFHEEVLRHIERADREMVPSTLMFVELDHFKSVNDRLGHEVGDEVLRRVATVLRDIVRPADLVARLGGDEFAIWLGGADHMTAAERAEMLRYDLPAAIDEMTGGVPPRITLSVGIATRAARADEDLDSLIRRADEAMYEAKRNGRGHWRVSLREAG